MSTDDYIIRRNSPESRLLSHLGFDRNTLQVAEWRGRRRSKGGYGTTPVAWRIDGETDVRMLCEGILRIIGGRPRGQLTHEDQKALDRAQRTLAAFENQAQRAASCERVLRRRLPCASETDLVTVMSLVEHAAPESVDDLLSRANDALVGRPAAWERARTEFVNTMNRSMGAP